MKYSLIKKRDYKNVYTPNYFQLHSSIRRSKDDLQLPHSHAYEYYSVVMNIR